MMKYILAALMITGIGMGQVSAYEVGIINMQAVFERYNKAIEADKKFQEKKEKYDEKLAKYQEMIEEARSKKAKEAKIQKLVDEMQKEMGPLQTELIQFRNEITYSIRQKVLSVSKQVAKEQGIDIVLDQQAVLMGGYDITEFVLDRLNNAD